MPRWLRYSTLIAISFASIAMLGLAISLFNPKLFDRYFPFLLVLNAVIAAVLFCVVTTLCLRLARRQRSKQYGSHMTAKLALTTALISVVPTLTVYAISTAFISRSLQDSFSPRVEASLDAGVRITQEMLAKQEQSTQELARDFADALAGTPDSLMLHDLLKLLEPHSGTEALVLTSTGSAVAAAGSRINVLMPDLPSQLQLKTASSQQLFLQLTQPVDKTIGLHAATLVAGYREYQQLAYSQSSMATLYALTLSLIVLLAVFASVLAALSFARRTTSPVMQLAEGTRRVATGDFMPIREFQGGDEINVLTRSFNSMIKEVSEARRGLELQRLQAEQAQAFLERVLGNISSGVVVVDHWYTVVTANQAARRIMGEQNVMTGASLRDTLPEFVSTLEEYQHRESIGTPPEPLDFELEQNGVTIPLYLKTTPMQLGTQTGSVLVFDDVTALMKAQRATAWGEVARRLAHEIKNPLTPIRLSAERLAWKLHAKLTEEKDLQLLQRTTNTIIEQVDTLRQMVNDFREYARMPAASLVPLNLNEFMETVLQLYHDAGHAISFVPGEGLPEIDADPAQLRQVFHNLISNSLEAVTEGELVRISIRTEALESKYHAGAIGAVKLSIEDNGPGFTDKILNAAFDPYVTTKPTGTGLGLPIVKKILDDHGAAIKLKNRSNEETGEILGASVEIVFKVSRLEHNPISN